MSIQHERVVELCNELRLGGVAAQHTALAQKAAEKRTTFTDFVEELLRVDCSRELTIPQVQCGIFPLPHFHNRRRLLPPEGTARIFEPLWILAVWDRNLKFKKEKNGHEKNSGDLSCVMFRVCLVGDGVG